MSEKLLIFGNGWIGNKLAAALGAEIAQADITNRQMIASVLEEKRPTVVINAAGKTGKTNVDDCEADPTGTLLSNVAGPVLLASECVSREIFMVHLGSGCVYTGLSYAYTEDDPPNFFGSIYSRSKMAAEAALKNLPVLQLRLRMPFDGKPHPRNLITKITKYKRVISVPNSLTCLDDLIPACLNLIKSRQIGIWNMVNPGAVTHGRILTLYRQIVDPNFTFETMSLEELSQITKAGRSNCVLDCSKLKRVGISMLPIEEALIRALREYKASL